jgi:hypothetical protein
MHTIFEIEQCHQAYQDGPRITSREEEKFSGLLERYKIRKSG